MNTIALRMLLLMDVSCLTSGWSYLAINDTCTHYLACLPPINFKMASFMASRLE